MGILVGEGKAFQEGKLHRDGWTDRQRGVQGKIRGGGQYAE